MTTTKDVNYSKIETGKNWRINWKPQHYLFPGYQPSGYLEF